MGTHGSVGLSVQKNSFRADTVEKQKSLTDLIGWFSTNERTTAISNRPINCSLMCKRSPVPWPVPAFSSQRPRSFWSAPRIATSGRAQQRKSTIHGLPVTLRMLRVKSDKSDWFWFQSIVFTNPFKTGMSLDTARGRDSWCWPKGARPLGTRMQYQHLELPLTEKTAEVLVNSPVDHPEAENNVHETWLTLGLLRFTAFRTIVKTSLQFTYL